MSQKKASKQRLGELLGMRMSNYAKALKLLPADYKPRDETGDGDRYQSEEDS